MHFLSGETTDWNLTLHLTGNKTKFPDSVSDQEQYFQFLLGKSVHWEPLQPLLESRELESILRLILKKPTCVPVTGLPICRLRMPSKSTNPSPPVIMTNHVSFTLEKTDWTSTGDQPFRSRTDTAWKIGGRIPPFVKPNRNDWGKSSKSDYPYSSNQSWYWSIN